MDSIDRFRGRVYVHELPPQTWPAALLGFVFSFSEDRGPGIPTIFVNKDH